MGVIIFNPVLPADNLGNKNNQKPLIQESNQTLCRISATLHWVFFGQQMFFLAKNLYLPVTIPVVVIDVSVEVGKYGRIVLPKHIRKKYGVDEGMRLIVTEYMGRICLIPVKRYKNPTEAIYGSIKVDKPIDDPKRMAREHIRKQLLEDL